MQLIPRCQNVPDLAKKRGADTLRCRICGTECLLPGLDSTGSNPIKQWGSKKGVESLQQHGNEMEVRQRLHLRRRGSCHGYGVTTWHSTKPSRMTPLNAEYDTRTLIGGALDLHGSNPAARRPHTSPALNARNISGTKRSPAYCIQQ